MSRLYADENFPLPVIKFLRNFGHDILTAKEAEQDNQRIPDEDMLSFAISNKRAILTRNRRDFIRLHCLNSDHTGIIVCSEEPNFEEAAIAIHELIIKEKSLEGKLIRVIRANN